jgi:hypothetical protein
MPYHSTKSKMEKSNPDDKIKKNLDRLKSHKQSKKHISLMRKFIKEGMSFTKAHNKALKEDSK